MALFLEYLKYNYPTLLLIAATIIMSLMRKGAKIKEIVNIYVMLAMTFALSVLEYVEIWIDESGADYRLLYYKAMLVYWLYPMILLFLIYTVGVKHKLLIAIPQLILMILTAVDLTGTCIIYAYSETHVYTGGPLTSFPFIVEDIYIIIFGILTVRTLGEKNNTKSAAIIFIVVTLIAAQLLLDHGMPNEYVPCIISGEILVYYFYLAAIEYMNIQQSLTRRELELEKSKTDLLLSQMRPHFINGNLSAIRGLCYEDAEKAVEMLDHFSEYLGERIKLADNEKLISFCKEMESVDNYLYLEMQRFPGRINVEKDIQIRDFKIPPFAVQTIVENAVKYGISKTGKRGTIKIRTYTEPADRYIVLCIEDDGSGFDTSSVDFGSIEHVGIKNTRERVQRLLGGKLEIESEVDRGTRVLMYIPQVRK